MRIITTGPKYLDIDAYACVIAYAELLNLLGEPAVAYSSATPNESITRTIRTWPVNFFHTYTPTERDSFTIVDVSDPQYLDHAVVIDRVDEVIDHHVGFEAFWNETGHTNVTIDFIGAAATLIYEKWVTAGRSNEMSKTSAGLLISAILDNTLNFQATVTDPRDHIAYEALLKIADLPDNWTEQYFSDCQASIDADVAAAIQNDTKLQTFTQLNLGEIAIGQLVVWDAKKIAATHIDTLAQAMREKSTSWFINLVSISEGKSYFIATDSNVQAWAEKVLETSFDGNVAKASRLWLRKEIVKQDLRG